MQAGACCFPCRSDRANDVFNFWRLPEWNEVEPRGRFGNCGTDPFDSPQPIAKPTLRVTTIGNLDGICFLAVNDDSLKKQCE